MRRYVTVNELDIRMGKRFSSTECPVSRAIRRSLPADVVEVALSSVRLVLKDESTYRRLRLSPAVSRWIRCYDKAGPVQPIKFLVDTSRIY